jgi:hypothetical protein
MEALLDGRLGWRSVESSGVEGPDCLGGAVLTQHVKQRLALFRSFYREALQEVAIANRIVSQPDRVNVHEVILMCDVYPEGICGSSGSKVKCGPALQALMPRGGKTESGLWSITRRESW